MAAERVPEAAEKWPCQISDALVFSERLKEWGGPLDNLTPSGKAIVLLGDEVRTLAERLGESEQREAEKTTVLAFVTDWTFDKAIEKFNELIVLAESLNPPPENTALLYRYCGWLLAIRDQVAPFSGQLVAERSGWDAKFGILDRLEQAARAFDADLSDNCDGPARDDLRAALRVLETGVDPLLAPRARASGKPKGL